MSHLISVQYKYLSPWNRNTTTQVDSMSWGQFWTNHDGQGLKFLCANSKKERCGSWHLALTGTLQSFKSSRYRCETSTLFILMQVDEFHLGDKQLSSFKFQLVRYWLVIFVRAITNILFFFPYAPTINGEKSERFFLF